jgi:conjugal transfer pilin signal peptidase TrbI
MSMLKTIDDEVNIKKRNNYKKYLLNTCCLIFIISSAWALCLRFAFVINTTDSLPHKCFIVHLKQPPKVGDYVLFEPPLSANLPERTKLTKQILGCPGDLVSAEGLDYFINGKWVAKAKTHSLRGESLQPGPVGLLGKRQFYVGTKHPDSFDSRYKRMGWISQDYILGVAYPVW